jgi:putative multiple sugar transport system substrate-binding protein
MSLEILAGPNTDINAKAYYDGAMELLNPYIASGKLQVVSNRTEYDQVSEDSWMVSDAKIAMQDRLTFYNPGDRPDMVLAAIDNQAQGVIEALGLAGITDMPVITGQDNTAMAQSNIKRHLQTMTIDKNLMDMAYNTGLIVNGLLSNSPVQASQKVSGIPVFYSPLTVMTVDSY